MHTSGSDNHCGCFSSMKKWQRPNLSKFFVLTSKIVELAVSFSICPMKTADTQKSQVPTADPEFDWKNVLGYCRGVRSAIFPTLVEDSKSSTETMLPCLHSQMTWFRTMAQFFATRCPKQLWFAKYEMMNQIVGLCHFASCQVHQRVGDGATLFFATWETRGRVVFGERRAVVWSLFWPPLWEHVYSCWPHQSVRVWGGGVLLSPSRQTITDTQVPSYRHPPLL